MLKWKISEESLNTFFEYLASQHLDLSEPMKITAAQIIRAWEYKRTDYIKPKDDASLREAFDLGFEEGRNS